MEGMRALVQFLKGKCRPQNQTEKGCLKEELAGQSEAEGSLKKDGLVTELSCITPKAVYHLRLIQENAQISW